MSVKFPITEQYCDGYKIAYQEMQKQVGPTLDELHHLDNTLLKLNKLRGSYYSFPLRTVRDDLAVEIKKLNERRDQFSQDLKAVTVASQEVFFKGVLECAAKGFIATDRIQPPK